MKAATGYVIYRGPSLLDGAPIVAIALVGKSTNTKTGAMVQTYIMRADVAPLEAIKTGDDASVCGDCKHRPSLGGACYVTVMHGPRSVYASLMRGNYPEGADAAQRARYAAHGRMVRLGTYGDPMAVPAGVWTSLLTHASGSTGYTHQWRNASVDASQRHAVLSMCMASADDPTEAEAARAAGYRHFRIRLADEPLMPREIVCPASAEGGTRMQCADCGACNGSVKARAASVAIIAHGPKTSRYVAMRAA